MGNRNNWISSGSIYFLKYHTRFDTSVFFCSRLTVWCLVGFIMAIEFDYFWGLLFYSPPVLFCEVALWLVRTELSRI